MVDYAKKRVKDHVGRFTKLYYMMTKKQSLIEEDKLDESNMLFLEDIENKDDIFPEMDYMIYY